MPGAAVFIATMHQPARVAGSAATSTPMSPTEAAVLFTVLTLLVIVMGVMFLAAMREQDRLHATLLCSDKGEKDTSGRSADR